MKKTNQNESSGSGSGTFKVPSENLLQMMSKEIKYDNKQTAGRRESRKLVDSNDSSQKSVDFKNAQILQTERRESRLDNYNYDADFLVTAANFMRKRFQNATAIEQVYRMYVSRPMNKKNILTKATTSRAATGLGLFNNGELTKGSYIYSILLNNNDLESMLTQMIEIDDTLQKLYMMPLPVFSETNIPVIESNLDLFKTMMKYLRAAVNGKPEMTKLFANFTSCIIDVESGLAGIMTCLSTFSTNITQYNNVKNNYIHSMVQSAVIALQQAINNNASALDTDYATKLYNELE